MVAATEMGRGEFERLSRLYATLSELNRTIIRVESREELLQAVCRLTVDHAGFKVVWIGWTDRETRQVIPVARAGDSEGYLDKIKVYADDRPEGFGPVGTCLRDAQACIFNHFTADPRALPWHAAATAHGLHAVAALPIRFHGEVCGAFTVYAGEAGIFRDKEIALLDEIALAISFALENLEREEQRKRADAALRESEQRVRLKLESILSPAGDIGGLELADILDVREVQRLMEDFHKLVHVPIAIIDLKGKVLIGVGWQEICTRFHRVHPEARQCCLDSDTQLSSGIPPGEYRLYKCKNHLWDVATPIIVGGRHVGNLFTGQFFFDDEPLDYALFRAQARRYGFDEAEYLATLEAVPRLSRAVLDTAMAFFIKLADMLSKLSYSNIRLARSLAERDALMESLRGSEAKFRSYVEHAPLAVFVVDRQGRYVDFNPAALAMLGYDAEALSSKSIQDIAAEEDLAVALGGFAILTEAGHLESEFRLKGRDGRRIWVSLQAVKITDNRFMAFCYDLSERKRAEETLAANAQLAGANEALAQADRRKDEFLAMLAHELRNPLAPIRNAVQLLRQTCTKSPARRQHDIIERQIAHMARLLDDLLDVSRITHGKIDLRLRPLPLAGVLSHAVETASPVIQSRQHRLEWASPSDLYVEGDFDRLAQAVGNLLVNAAKYTEVGGRIWLETAREGSSVIIRVRDTGAGIAPAMQSRVFELFTQADHSLARTQGGLGIGLTMARALVRLHGGSIEVASEGLGKGSEFTIRLPALNGAWPVDQAPVSSKPVPNPAEAPALHILVVDDVVDTADSMVELLEGWGHTARACYDGHSALEAVRALRPDLVLLDIGLPGLDGYAVARCLREEHGSALRLIALTGYGQEADQRQALAAGFNHHLVKPVDLAALAALLAQAP